MFLAIDRVSKFAFVELHRAATMPAGAAFLRGVIAAFPYRLHTILTDNGIPFADQPRNRSGPTAQYRLHVFDRLCRERGTERRLTKPYHPWTNSQRLPRRRPGPSAGKRPSKPSVRPGRKTRLTSPSIRTSSCRD